MKKIVVIILLFNFQFCSGQNWLKLGEGFNFPARCLYADTAENILYAGGNFNHSGNVLMKSIAFWNGAKWDSMSHGSPSGNPVFAITKYQGDIIASGELLGSFINSVAKWNGMNWIPYDFSVSSVIISFLERDNKLYFGGAFDSINGIYNNGIGIWDGSTLQTINSNFEYHYINGIQFLNNTLYIGGNFYDTVNTAIGDFAQWNGNSILPVTPPFMSFGPGNINAMTVYNNELYVGGYFLQSWGDAGNYIMKWTGSSWLEVGGGTDSYIYNLAVHDGYLYACGAFNVAGGQPASKIARWDGNSWSSLGSDNFDGSILAMAFLKDTLYIAGNFINIDTTVFKRVAKYNQALLNGIDKINLTESLSLYPNPASSTISFTNIQIQGYQITNTLGQVLKQQTTNPGEKNITIDVSDLLPGVYFIRAKTKDGIMNGKFVKQ